jgi:hypothetical protein
MYTHEKTAKKDKEGVIKPRTLQETQHLKAIATILVRFNARKESFYSETCHLSWEVT